MLRWVLVQTHGIFYSQSKRSLKSYNHFKKLEARNIRLSQLQVIYFHIRADHQALCYELGNIINQQLGKVTYPIDEVHGFRYFDGRAIIGFVDGTENPEPVIAAQWALVGNEDPDFIGGSYAFIQKYTHDMEKWRSLTDEEQEKVIGRKKFNDVELGDDEKPLTAHNVVSKAHDAEGNELKIMRANMPFSNPSRNEYGTFFIGYSRKFSTTRQMLENMFLGNEDGNLDRLLDFSTAQTGTLFCTNCRFSR